MTDKLDLKRALPPVDERVSSMEAAMIASIESMDEALLARKLPNLYGEGEAEAAHLLFRANSGAREQPPGRHRPGPISKPKSAFQLTRASPSEEMNGQSIRRRTTAK